MASFFGSASGGGRQGVPLFQRALASRPMQQQQQQQQQGGQQQMTGFGGMFQNLIGQMQQRGQLPSAQQQGSASPFGTPISQMQFANPQAQQWLQNLFGGGGGQQQQGPYPGYLAPGTNNPPPGMFGVMGGPGFDFQAGTPGAMPFQPRPFEGYGPNPMMGGYKGARGMYRLGSSTTWQQGQGPPPGYAGFGQNGQWQQPNDGNFYAQGGTPWGTPQQGFNQDGSSFGRMPGNPVDQWKQQHAQGSFNPMQPVWPTSGSYGPMQGYGRVAGSQGLRGPDQSPFANLRRLQGPFGNGGGSMMPTVGSGGGQPDDMVGRRWF